MIRDALIEILKKNGAPAENVSAKIRTRGLGGKLGPLISAINGLDFI